MNHTDCGFPIIEYEKGKSFREWGRAHGEDHREAIRELYEIRRELMLNNCLLYTSDAADE